MPDAETPQFRVSNEGEPVPPVDPEDLKRRRNTWKQHLTCDAARAAQSEEANSVAVTHRFRMVSSLEGFNHGQLLAPWKHGEDLDDAVFRVRTGNKAGCPRTVVGCLDQMSAQPQSSIRQS